MVVEPFLHCARCGRSILLRRSCTLARIEKDLTMGIVALIIATGIAGHCAWEELKHANKTPRK